MLTENPRQIPVDSRHAEWIGRTRSGHTLPEPRALDAHPRLTEVSVAERNMTPVALTCAASTRTQQYSYGASPMLNLNCKEAVHFALLPQRAWGCPARRPRPKLPNYGYYDLLT